MRFYFPICFYLNQLTLPTSLWEKTGAPAENLRLSAVLIDSFHMSGALCSSNIENVLTENRIHNFRGERRAPDHCATEAPNVNMD